MNTAKEKNTETFPRMREKTKKKKTKKFEITDRVTQVLLLFCCCGRCDDEDDVVSSAAKNPLN